MRLFTKRNIAFLLIISIFATYYFTPNLFYAQNGDIFKSNLEESNSLKAIESDTTESTTKSGIIVASSNIEKFNSDAKILYFDDVYDYENRVFKSFDTLVTNGIVEESDREFVLYYNYNYNPYYTTIDQIIFTGIPNLPVDSKLDIHVLNDNINNVVPVYFAVDKGVVVNNITVSGDWSYPIGAVVVAGEADSIIVDNSTSFNLDRAITTLENGELAWVSVEPSSDPVNDKATGVVIGAYDGGKIKGDIIIGDLVNISSQNEGFLGAVIGAYKNATVGNITIGDNLSINANYVQSIIGANENSTVLDITTEQYLNIGFTNARFTIIGAASGLPILQPENDFKSSSVGTIKMRQATNIYGNGMGNEKEDDFSNVGIGSERGSYVKKIIIKEDYAHMDPTDPEYYSRYYSFSISSSSRVSVGAFDNGIIGDDITKDAIYMHEITFTDNSYSPGTMIIGSGKKSTINGNINLESMGVTTYFYSVNPYKGIVYYSAVGASEGGKINGSIILNAFAYSTWLETPPTIIGPYGVDSYVKEVLIDTFAAIRSYKYEVEDDTIIGSKDGKIDLLNIKGDMLIQLPKTPESSGNYDFIADKIVIDGGNIIGQDMSIKEGLVDGAQSVQEYYRDPDSENWLKIPPWLHSDFKMSVSPVNSYGDSLQAYSIFDPESKVITADTGIIKAKSRNGNVYDYTYGNDIRPYLDQWGMDDPLLHQSYIRPSWVPDIYPVYPDFSGNPPAYPYTHYVYLPMEDIEPIEYNPAQEGDGAYEVYDAVTSVVLNLPIKLTYLNESTLKPEIFIYKEEDNSLVTKFELSFDNLSKFYLSYDGYSENLDNEGDYIVLVLDNIDGLEKNVLYRADIPADLLHTQFAVSEEGAFELTALNSNLISWKFLKMPTLGGGIQIPPPSTTEPIQTSTAPSITSPTLGNNSGGSNNADVSSTKEAIATSTTNTTIPTKTPITPTIAPTKISIPTATQVAEIKTPKPTQSTKTDDQILDNDSAITEGAKETINNSNESNVVAADPDEIKAINIEQKEFISLPIVESMGNKYRIKPVGDDLYYIYDMDGLALGKIQLKSGEKLENINIDDMMIPFSSVIKKNPQTGDSYSNVALKETLYLIILLALCIFIKYKNFNSIKND